MTTKSSTLTGLAPLSILALGLAGGAAAETDRLEGEATVLFGGSIATWAELDEIGTVTEVGVTLPMRVVAGAPAEHDHSRPFMADAVLAFPEIVRETTFLDHLGLFWEPHGHPPPGRYDTPHFDFHFFHIGKDEAAAIDCADLETRLPAEAIPAGWLPSVPPGDDPAMHCVPLMGFHSLPVSEFSAPGVLQEGHFEQVMLGGEYGGRFIFLEPMVTVATLEARESFSMPVPWPPTLEGAGLYPTTFELRHDPAADAWDLVFGGFKPYRPSPAG